jgi:2-(1,2-epoxy-1,2-dihydrophenyl)acetyl-CoA isomerase
VTVAEAPVLLDVADGTARITLNRPESANAIDVALARALQESVARVAEADGIRVVLLTGAGDRFCGGGDVRSFAQSADLAANLDEVLAHLHPAVAMLGELEVPVVASVQGSAAGAGLALVAGADLVLAAYSATFVMAYTGIGLVPDGGSTWYLPRVIGPRRALELSLTNWALSADEAHEWGLVTRVLPDSELVEKTEAFVAQLAAGPTQAYAAAKRLLRSSASESASLENQLALEASEMVTAGRTADGVEGVRAFAEKRKPEFRGE